MCGIFSARGEGGVHDLCYLKLILTQSGPVMEMIIIHLLSMITQIREDTNTKIEMPKEAAHSDVIVITGTKDNVEKARKRILEIQNQMVRAVNEEVEGRKRERGREGGR